MGQKIAALNLLQRFFAKTLFWTGLCAWMTFRISSIPRDQAFFVPTPGNQIENKPNVSQ